MQADSNPQLQIASVSVGSRIDCLILADGTSIDVKDGREIIPEPVERPQTQFIAVPSNTELVQREVQVRRRLMDLPDIPSNMNALALVFCYSSFGLADDDISQITQLSIETIERIRSLEAYQKLSTDITESILAQDADDVRGIIARHARSAASKLVGLLDHRDDGLRVLAIRDVLDRSGHRPADIVEHRVRMEGGLVIKHVKQEDVRLPSPIIELTEAVNVDRS